MKKTLLAISLTLATGTAMADARTSAMGGAGVASANYLSAPFVNPALLTSYKDSDDFGLLLPSINVFSYNSDELIDKVDNLQNSYDSLDSLMASGSLDQTAIQNSASQLRDDFSALSGASLGGEGNLAFALSIPNQYLTTTVFAQTTFDISARTNIADADVALLDNIANETNPLNFASYDLDDLSSSAGLMGVAISEFGLSFAKEFELNGQKFSVGISPKYQQVDTFNYLVDVESFEEDDFDGDAYSNGESNFNLDIGATYAIDDNWTVALVGKNLIEESYQSIAINGEQFTYEVEALFTAGVAYNSDFFNASLDVDLTDQQHFNDADKTQYVRAGAEVNAWDWAKVRVGYRHDLEDNRDDVATAGLGFSLWDTVNLDITALYSGEDEFGAGMQTSFTF
jgi:hypothetical protein